MLVYAIIFISLALVFYTVGVFGEKIKGTLTKVHFMFFAGGLVCDSTGTFLMSRISESQATISIHSITGALAIGLMLIHTIWAYLVLKKGDDDKKKVFHRFSLIVWFIWLIPYLSGAIFAMG